LAASVSTTKTRAKLSDDQSILTKSEGQDGVDPAKIRELVFIAQQQISDQAGEKTDRDLRDVIKS
jgi:hypothetical protein